MADFERKLSMLAERGARVGPEEMIERVEAELAQDPLVVVTKQRKGSGMSVQTDKPTDQRGRSRARGLAWGVAAFVAVIALGGIYLALADGGGDPTRPEPAITPTTVAEITTTTRVPTTEGVVGGIPFEERMATIEAMIAARNSGDFDAWRAAFIAERPEILGGQIEDDSELEWQRSYVAANDVWTITGPCDDVRPVAPYLIRCPMTLRNDFHGPGGLFYAVSQMDLTLNSDGQLTGIGAEAWEIAGDPGEYNTAFDAWLAEAHPDVHAGFGPRVEGEDGLPNSEDMPVAIRYVDEFLERSDVYPLEPGD